MLVMQKELTKENFPVLNQKQGNLNKSHLKNDSVKEHVWHNWLASGFTTGKGTLPLQMPV